MKRELMTLYGGCFAPELGYILRLSSEFEARYEIVSYWLKGGGVKHDLTVPDELKASARVVVYIPEDWLHGIESPEYGDFLASLPANAQHISCPYPSLPVLWPYHSQDPRMHSVANGPMDDNNTLLLAYADVNVIRMRQEGMAAEEIVEAYRKFSAPDALDLDRLREQNFEKLDFLDRSTDIKVAEFMNDKLVSHGSMLCANHPANTLLLHMANQILVKLNIKPLPSHVLDGLTELIPPMIPIHPSIIAYFGLTWIDENTRCIVDRRRNLTWDEYIYQLSRDH